MQTAQHAGTQHTQHGMTAPRGMQTTHLHALVPKPMLSRADTTSGDGSAGGAAAAAAAAAAVCATSAGAREGAREGGEAHVGLVGCVGAGVRHARGAGRQAGQTGRMQPGRVALCCACMGGGSAAYWQSATQPHTTTQPPAGAAAAACCGCCGCASSSGCSCSPGWGPVPRRPSRLTCRRRCRCGCRAAT